MNDMRYVPNPAHKRETTEAGPPRWRPDKELCPKMSPRERSELLRASIPSDDQEASRRYAARRIDGRLELVEAKLTQVIDGRFEYHGHPTSRVPARVLRLFLRDGVISEAEYGRLVRELG